MLNKRFSTDREVLEDECDISFFRASGPGGQHRNKRDTAVRLRHRVSGIIVEASDSRSQSQNREAAFERLTNRLKSLNRVEKKRVPTRPSKTAKKRRTDAKKLRGKLKRSRRHPDVDD